MIANRKSILKSLFVAVFLLFSVSALFLLNACDNKKEINIYKKRIIVIIFRYLS